MNKILERLKEPSTIRGLIALVAVAGIAVSPEQINAIIVVAGILYSAIQVIRKEKK